MTVQYVCYTDETKLTANSSHGWPVLATCHPLLATCVLSTVTNVCDHDEPKACPGTIARVRLPLSECGSLLFTGRESAILRRGRYVSGYTCSSVGCFRRAVRSVFPDGRNAACPSSGWSVGRVGWIGKKGRLSVTERPSECGVRAG